MPSLTAAAGENRADPGVSPYSRGQIPDPSATGRCHAQSNEPPRRESLRLGSETWTDLRTSGGSSENLVHRTADLTGLRLGEVDLWQPDAGRHVVTGWRPVPPFRTIFSSPGSTSLRSWSLPYLARPRDSECLPGRRPRAEPVQIADGPHLIAPFERPFHTNARALVESGMAGP